MFISNFNINHKLQQLFLKIQYFNGRIIVNILTVIIVNISVFSKSQMTQIINCTLQFHQHLYKSQSRTQIKRKVTRRQKFSIVSQVHPDCLLSRFCLIMFANLNLFCNNELVNKTHCQSIQDLSLIHI